MRKLTQFEKNVFEFLNELRDSAATNMFFATPYIQNAYGIGKEEALSILKLWMKNFKADGDYNMIEITS